MTTTPAAAADRPTLFCFAKCRDRRTYTRQLGSRPVYSCDGCGSTREIEELGRVEIPGRISPVPAPKPYTGNLKPFVAPKKRAYTNRRQETKTMKKSPLIAAIEKAVAEQLKPVLERLDKLEEKPDVTEVDETVVKVMVEKVLADQLGGDVKPAASDDGSCRHKNFMRKCPSCQKRRAEDAK